MKHRFQLAILFFCFAIVPAPAQSRSNAAPAPASAQSLRQAALAFEQQGKLAEAEAAWKALEKAHPGDPEPYARMALIEAHHEHYKEAIPLYREALAINPDTSGLRRDLGLALFKSGDLKGAIAEFGILLKSQPGDFQLNTLVGMAHYGLAQYKDAVPYLRTAAATDKQNLPLRLALAHSCLWSKQYQCVMDTYQEMLALNANSAEADMIAAEAADDLHDNETSMRLFREAVKADPKAPNVHFGLGYLLWTLKRYADAIPEFQAELSNDPTHVQAMAYLADANIQLNHMDLARPLLEKAVQLNPALPIAHLDLGIVYTEEDRKPEALRELEAADKLDPNDIDVHWRLGRLYRALGRRDESTAEFEKASALNKAKDDENYRRISEANARHGDAPAATQPAPAAAPPAQPNQPN